MANWICNQSICIHCSCFENIGQFVTKMWTWKKYCEKKQGHRYSKREEGRLPLLFLNNNVPVFCFLLFSGPDPKKISGLPDKLEQWVQIDWASTSAWTAKSPLGADKLELGLWVFGCSKTVLFHPSVKKEYSQTWQ